MAISEKQIKGIDLSVRATKKVFPFVKGWEFTPDWEKYSTVIYVNLYIDFIELGKFLNMEVREYWLESIKSGEKFVTGALLTPFDWGDYGTDNWEKISDISHNLRLKINDTLSKAYQFIPDDMSIFYSFGCRSQVIKEVQICLGMVPKHQTGNFGPITLRELKSKRGEDTITKEVYDSIKQSCQGSTTDTQVKINPTNLDNVIKTPEFKKVNIPPMDLSAPTESQDELYNRFIRDGLIFGRNQGNRIVYKGPDLTDEDIQKLTQSMANKGFVLSRENLDYRKGDKLIYKRD